MPITDNVTKDGPVLKTREELVAMFKNEYLDLISMTIEVEGFDEKLEYSQDMEDLPQELFFHLPEYSKYYLTIKYKVIAKPLTRLTYQQVVKKGGIVFKKRNEHITDEAPINDENTPYHTVSFPIDSIPGGSIVRGKFDASSTFYAEGEKVLSIDWKLKIIKKDCKPMRAGYAD